MTRWHAPNSGRDYGWMVYIHEYGKVVVPASDSIPHQIGSRCVCKPRTERNEIGMPVYIHTSNDARKAVERSMRTIFPDYDPHTSTKPDSK